LDFLAVEKKAPENIKDFKENYMQSIYRENSKEKG
jgi:hypothetical protein